MTRRCIYDGCCDFEPGSHNAAYCQPCKCKRKAENAKKRLRQELLVYDAEAWELEERRKLARAERTRAKNAWILENRTFCFFDLETTNLDANIGEILAGCIKPMGEPAVIFSDSVKDSNIVAQIRDELSRYDYVVTWFGARFDIPYLQTRLVTQGFEPMEMIRHIDLYFTARSHLKLHSNRLNVVAESLFRRSEKTRIIGDIWNRAARGDEDALQYIIDHCVKDVDELEEIFRALVNFRNLAATPVRLFR